MSAVASTGAPLRDVVDLAVPRHSETTAASDGAVANVTTDAAAATAVVAARLDDAHPLLAALLRRLPVFRPAYMDACAAAGAWVPPAGATHLWLSDALSSRANAAARQQLRRGRFQSRYKYI